MATPHSNKFEHFSADELVILLDGLEAIAFPEGTASETAMAGQVMSLADDAVMELGLMRGADVSTWRGYFPAVKDVMKAQEEGLEQ